MSGETWVWADGTIYDPAINDYRQATPDELRRNVPAEAEPCMEPCCVAKRENAQGWKDYIDTVRVIVRARTGQRIASKAP